MTHLHAIVGSQARPALPVVRKIRLTDLKDALAKGLDDFWAFPTHVIFLSIGYPVFGLVLTALAFGGDLFPLLFPLAAGFALIGPVAATGLYEMSRRREMGLEVSWKDAFGARQSPSVDGILALGALLAVIFLLWMAAAQAIYIAYFGYGPPASVSDFVSQVLTTPAGWKLIAVGNGVGFLFAAGVLMISVVSFPLLLDRDVGAAAAMLTSMRAVLRNPIPMAVWGLIVAGLLLIGSLPLFVGLAIVMPVLGHSTWHLYRKVVEPDPNPRQDAPQPPPQRGRRYAAQFPASLFAGDQAEPKAPPGVE
ncbi:MAG TPA: DUF2189 domain-containing protein [Xanthobacteraceae bacterium]|jgi:uncharacterized membrane protein